MDAIGNSNGHCIDSKAEPDKHISRCGGLSRAEEHELARLIANGDRDARNRLVVANLGLVVKIARGFQGRGLDCEDAIGEGNLGLIRAAENFQTSFGTRFSTFAAYLIKERIRYALINTSATIRLPSHMFRLLTRWRRAEAMLCHQWGRRPTFAEVASELNLTAAQMSMVAQAHSARQPKLMGSYDRQSGHQLCDDVWDRQPSGEEIAESEEEWTIAVRRMESLDIRERGVLALRFGLGGEVLTLNEIGRRYGLTQPQARMVVISALRKLVSTESRSLPCTL